MDDPWGSPWASAISDAPVKHDPTASPPKALLSLPPRAFFGSNANSPTQSPWLEHGNGEWTASNLLEDAAAAAGPSAPWGPWAEVGSTPRIDSPGKQSPIAWPSSAATSPGLKPTLRQRSSTLFRHASPDPWAVGSPWLDKDVTPPPIGRPSTEDRAAKGDITNKAVVISIEEPQGGAKDPQDCEFQTTIHDRKSELVPDNNDHKNVMLTQDRLSRAEVHDSPSRLSSDSSNGSSPGLHCQDSPITSIDEDPAGGVRHSARTTSRKVSELVGLYDGLARAASEEPPHPEKQDRGAESRDRSRIISPTRDCDLNAGGRLNNGTITTRNSPILPEGSNESATSTISLVGRQELDAAPENDDPQANQTAPISTAIKQLTEKFGLIKFEPELGLLDAALGASLSSHQEADAQDNLLDRIVTDSFSTVDERKAWYRISRFGSMRKHNSGNDENYHHVYWPDSHIHTDTIKLVRRWMEEDSFSGKPILGGIKRTNAFNWDSSAAPVGLDKIFARRSLGTYPRTSSLAPFGHTPTSSIGSLGSVLEDRTCCQDPSGTFASGSAVSASALPVASFGWSSDPVIPLAKPSGQVLSSNFSAAFTDVPALHPVNSTPPRSNPASPGTGELEGAAGDEEDDWGEMVVSPSHDSFTNLNTVDSDDQQHGRSDALVSPKMQIQTAFSDSLGREASAEASIIDLKGSKSTSSILPNQEPALLAIAKAAMDPNADSRNSADRTNLAAPANSAVPRAGCPLPRISPSLPSGQGLGIRFASAKVILAPIQSSSKRSDDDAVEEILRDIPDLTYML